MSGRVEQVKGKVQEFGKAAKAHFIDPLTTFDPSRRDLFTQEGKTVVKGAIGLGLGGFFAWSIYETVTAPQPSLEQKAMNKFKELTSQPGGQGERIPLKLKSFADYENTPGFINTKMARLMHVFYPGDTSVKFINRSIEDGAMHNLLESTFLSTGLSKRWDIACDYAKKPIILIQRMEDSTPKTDIILGDGQTFTYCKIPYEAMMDAARMYDINGDGFLQPNRWAETVSKDPRIEVRQLPEVELKGNLLVTKNFVEQILGKLGIMAKYRFETDARSYDSSYPYLRIQTQDYASLLRLEELNSRMGNIQRHTGRFVVNGFPMYTSDVLTREGLRRLAEDADWSWKRPTEIPQENSEVLEIHIPEIKGFFDDGAHWKIATLPEEKKANPAYK